MNTASKSLMVHVVVAVWDHEGSTLICASTDKAEAEAVVARCERHEARNPPWPDDDADLEAFYKKRERWRKRHPAGAESAEADRYRVDSIPLL